MDDTLTGRLAAVLDLDSAGGRWATSKLKGVLFGLMRGSRGG